MSAAVEEARDATHDLGQQIIDLIGAPKDAWEIAAQLEVMGLRDVDARAYGERDLFSLAHRLYARFQDGAFRLFIEGEDEERVSAIGRFLRYYLTGLSFSVPMALQAIVMLVWGYGIWGAIDLDSRTGSAIALGFIASYVVTGGFSQAIVRRGLFHIYQNDGWLARWTVLHAYSVSLRIVLALVPLALFINFAFEMLPWSMMLMAAGYYAALSVLWLNWSMLYLLRKTGLFALTTAIALGAVLAAALLLQLGPVAANAVGLFVADVLTFGIALRHLNRIARDRSAAEPVNPPRLTVLVYSTSRFFLYGLLSNTFLFADRMIAWTSHAGREDFPPYGFWLNVRYELGMDLALVVVMVLSGMVEYAARRFSETLIPNEKRIKAGDAQLFLDDARRAQRARMLHLGLASIVAFALAIFIADFLRAHAGPSFHEPLISATTTRVFWIAAIAYVIYMFAVQNMLMLLTLSRVELVARAVAIALATNIAIGFVCSRAIHYSFAALGLLGGSIVLFLLTQRSMSRVLAELDTSYYAAY
ncbi:MAG TPA: exopolysaccharide Pel transporter PelG [Thermoanaerobaculia bacterium]|nr:exopolysaccharide Pel transporter PelG [Thermoanaerobaculia bacterium]